MSAYVGTGDAPCHVTNDHWWHGGSVCTSCGARLRCDCGRFVREDDLDRHLRSGECRTVPSAAPCWPGECDACCSACEAVFAVDELAEARRAARR